MSLEAKQVETAMALIGKKNETIAGLTKERDGLTNENERLSRQLSATTTDRDDLSKKLKDAETRLPDADDLKSRQDLAELLKNDPDLQPAAK